MSVTQRAKDAIKNKVRDKARAANSGLRGMIRRKVFDGRCAGCNTGLPAKFDGWLCRNCTRNGGGGALGWMSLAEQEAWDALTPNERARALKGK